MGVKVAKFGGSSVADALQIEKIRNIIENDEDIKYVVVSAPGKRFSEDSKVTDLLYLCKTHIEHKIPYEQIFQVICDRFMAVEVNLDVDIDLEHEFEEIKRNLEAGASADYIASRGEYLNAMIIASYLGYDFVDAAKIVKFDEKGRFMEELTDKAIKKELANHEKAVILNAYYVGYTQSTVCVYFIFERLYKLSASGIICHIKLIFGNAELPCKLAHRQFALAAGISDPFGTVKNRTKLSGNLYEAPLIAEILSYFSQYRRSGKR